MDNIDIQILHCGKKPIPKLEDCCDYPELLQKVLSDSTFNFSKLWTVFEDSFPPDVRSADVWLITGSPFGAYENHDWIIRLIEFIEDAYEAGVPMVGVCFGHQVIAQALGGSVAKFPGGWSLGVNTYVFHDGSPIHMFAYHQDQVVEKPAAARVIAHNAFTKYAGLKYGDTVLTFQFHPDIFGDSMADIFEDESLPEYAVTRARQTLSYPTSEATVINYIKVFMKREHQLRSQGFAENGCACF